MMILSIVRMNCKVSSDMIKSDNDIVTVKVVVAGAIVVKSNVC